MQTKPVFEIPKDQKILILGPCSAESYEQLSSVCTQTMDLKPDLLRAGVWKPRTRPGSFEGKGEEALEWLIQIKKDFNIKVCTEVANQDHAEKCLKAGIDVLWVGARTTVNPFYVQEIADALKGTNVPVMIKNPLNPDLFLWLGAIERFYKAGLERIAAIHRGFSFYGNSIYRNVPRWQIPIELKRKLPEIQMIADVSHISGNPAHLQEIAQIAMDLNYDGLMVEVHPDPLQALSDSDQQVTPAFLKKFVLDQLIKRKTQSSNYLYNNKISEIRKEIDYIDKEIISLLAKRMQMADAIGIEKRNEEISIFQPERWAEIVSRLLVEAEKSNLSQEFIFSLTEAIHIESIQHQSAKMNNL
ncbi:MAG: bifunctional 3-deoxy-7-phosphoheptulonate synthase/chorismate mutase type II [Saprospiraceae bacterium]|nr:bifunctional 3-deoxy-7-phosphoheptulonate synthase/chorismate mutase type II [Candidatus Vicinibacter affinis]